MACSKTDAERAIKAYEKGWPQVDHTNAEQVQAYMEMRQWSKRITGEAFVKYLQKRKVNVTTGSRNVLPYWGVPKENFPSGLPETLLASELSASESAGMELMGGAEIDTDGYFIVDQVVERKLLGKKVRVFEFYVRRDARVRLNSDSEPASSVPTASPVPAALSTGIG